MSKIEILRDFDIVFTDPGAQKSGEYLEERILKQASKLIKEDRSGVIDVFREWISLREEPRTMIAVRISGVLCIKEMLPDVQKLREDIANQKVFFRFYNKWVDTAIASLSEK